MKKACLIFLLPLLICSCGHKIEGNVVSLKGNIKGLGNDTLYIYGLDQFYNRTDTIIARKDRFETVLQIDTLALVRLQFPDGTRYPLFIDKGQQLKINGSTESLEHLDVTGSPTNEELTAFHQELQEQPQLSEKQREEKIIAFINSHPSSLASTYLLEKYFAWKDKPDYNIIIKLIGNMSGELKDRPDISDMLEKINAIEKSNNGKVIPYFSITNPEGKRISRTNFKDQYLLLHFWASWDEQSRKANANLRQIYQQEKGDKNLAFLGISLDIDKNNWLNAIAEDSLEWEQGCDFNGWNSDVIKKLGIQSLPANLLLNPSGKVEAQNIDEQAFFQKWEKLSKKETKKP